MNEQSNKSDDTSIDSNSRPEYLYKHCKFYGNSEWTKRIFTHNEIFFPSPNQFNDPYDSRVRYVFEGNRSHKKNFMRNTILQIDPSLSSRELNEKVKQAMNNMGDIQDYLEQRSYDDREEMGIFCMTRKSKNILMWSHYSDKHQGFCLEFSADNEFFARALPISYVDDVPKYNMLGNQSIREIAETFLKKAKDWAYEVEWRIIDIDKGPGIQRFPGDSLTSVIMGANINQGHRQSILEWCAKRQSKTKVLCAKMNPERFALDIEEIK